jgi:anti-sigma regulatory factor (Ser/Thr protein kinase)
MFAACRSKTFTKAVDQWADYRKGYEFLNKNDDSAFYYFNRSATSSTDKKQVAAAYQGMALIQTDAGDNFGAQESLISSLRSLNEKDPGDRDYLARDYNGLGMSCYNLSDFGQALSYYKMALRYASDVQLRCNILNNSGNAAKELKSYIPAIRSYDAAMKMTGRSGITYARILTNMAIAKWLQNPSYNAAPELWQSLNIRSHDNDLPGENSSYSHLSEFYGKSHPDSAIWYAQKMRTIAGILHNPAEQLNALAKLILLSSPERSKTYFAQYQIIKDSLEIKRNAAKNQFAVIRYNVEKQNTENLALQKQNTERRFQLLAVVVLASLIVLWSILWFRKRKEHLQLLALQEVQDTKLQLSQKVHDRVANGIYRIMNEVEYSENIDKQDLADKLEVMYEISRDIAHDDESYAENFALEISNLLNAFKSKEVRLAVTGNEPGVWAGVNSMIKEQVELILQELMVNMSKHSEATHALISFELNEKDLKIGYRDNGIGIPQQVRTGKGLQNTVSRIKALNGTITFGNPPVKGLEIFMNIPLV